ncbi:MAG: hypothetical protein NUW37_14685 [Planctomycetes bacterium]|nr:hypothetical protein [Planctomycetota bacterium]
MPSQSKMIAFALIQAVLLLGLSCSSSSSHTPKQLVSLRGQVVKGPLSGATIECFAADGNLNKLYGLDSATTDAEGNFLLALNYFSGPVIIEHRGGSYIDEFSGEVITVDSLEVSLSAVVMDVGSFSSSGSVSVTPLTTMVHKRARVLVAAGKSFEAAVAEAYGEIDTFFELTDSLSTGAADLTDASASGASLESKSYGAILSGLCKVAQDLQIEAMELSKRLGADASDGDFDARDSTGAAISGLPSAGFPAKLAEGIEAFLASNRNASGVTSAELQIVETLAFAADSLPERPEAPEIVNQAGGDGKISISWDASSGALSYNVYYSADPVFLTDVRKLENVKSPLTIGGLTNEIEYNVYVTAVNRVGESDPGGTIQEHPKIVAPPRPMLGLPVTDDGSVKIAWDEVIDATEYDIYFAEGTSVTSMAGTRIARATSPHLQTGLESGTSYAFTVVARNAHGHSADSNVVVATPYRNLRDHFTFVDAAAGKTLNAVRAHGPKNVYACGEDGTVIFVDDATGIAQTIATGIAQDLRGIWSSGSSALYVVGRGGVAARMLGNQTFAKLTVPTADDLNAIDAASTDGIYIVGDSGGIFFGDGNGTFSKLGSPTTRNLNSVSALSAESFYAVGDEGTIVRRLSGGSVQLQNSGTDVNLRGVLAISETRIYACGENGTILHSSGDGSWSLVKPQEEGATYEGVFATGPNLVCFAGGDARGMTLTFVDVSGNVSSLVQAAGTARSVHGNRLGLWLAGDSGALIRYRHFFAEDSGTTTGLRGVWASGASDVYAVGSGGTILHSAGDEVWTKLASGTESRLESVWGSSSDDVYVAGTEGVILHRTTGDFAAESSGLTTTIERVWGFGAGSVYAISKDKVIKRGEDGSWSVVAEGAPTNLAGLWGSSAIDVYAGGSSAVLLRQATNGGWRTQGGTNLSFNIEGIFGRSGLDVFAVGDDVVAHSFGGPFVSKNAPVMANLRDVHGNSLTTIAVGDTGTILQVTGAAESSFLASGTAENLHGVFVLEDGTTYVVGASGTILRN